ncbi:uncharacterized protein Z519_08622 [Cladophialophora bantiana CBS 173.52]|uniref:SnoaL-like domain-containing protein n=2 Tax=Cladophialophora TaxID=82105 RepID=W9W5Y7_9EURO|nr:uncharacterized protein A1O5_11674 [Cladophialophora psammophila CBS 110553]XP_016617508.1 uncharacterized protein Z519_08622 [Cladophialophora bantiana CBS 173.52]EXJ63353.1 hypothetical protein A1O5_11674 [Cladophialophora psammophila CBS 110553]KIW90839.1 hypothetical protein Z519_08622 [Cladophialophora bantiana CBS 173.52]
MGDIDTIERTREIGRQLTERWCIPKGGDVEPFFELFSDDAICETMVKKELFPELGGRMTKQEFKDYVYAESRVTELKVWVTGITAEANRVAVEAASDMSVGKNIYQNVYHWLFEIKNGKVVHARFYLDTLLARKFVDWVQEAGGDMQTRK